MADPDLQDVGAASASKAGLASEPKDLASVQDGADGKKAAAKSDGSEVPLVFRALIGATGVALLVSFFLGWVRRELEASEDTVLLSGLALLQQDSLAGTPSIAVIVVPVLGTALAAIAFTGFRYTAYVSIGVSVLLFGYAAYVFFQIFVQHTGVGLWIATGAAFLALLLGAGAQLYMRRAADLAKAAKKDAKKDDGPAKA